MLAIAASAAAFAASFRPGRGLCSADALFNDRVGQNADLLDLDLDEVAGAHEKRRLTRQADPRGSPGDDDITALERHRFTDDRNKRCQVEHHVFGRGVLNDLSVEFGLQPQPSPAGR